jgi:hypothetical protein
MSLTRQIAGGLVLVVAGEMVAGTMDPAHLPDEHVPHGEQLDPRPGGRAAFEYVSSGQEYASSGQNRYFVELEGRISSTGGLDVFRLK